MRNEGIIMNMSSLLLRASRGTCVQFSTEICVHRGLNHEKLPTLFPDLGLLSRVLKPPSPAHCLVLLEIGYLLGCMTASKNDALGVYRACKAKKFLMSMSLLSQDAP